MSILGVYSLEYVRYCAAPQHFLEAPCDQELHDFVGTGIDPHHPRVAVHARDRELLHIAVTAEELQTAIDDLSLQIGQPVLGHGRGDGIERPVEIALDAVVVKHPRDRRVGLALGEGELGILEFDDLLAEGLTLLDVVNGESKRTLDHGLSMDRDDKTLARKIIHELREALALLGAKQTLRRKLHVLEEQFGGVGRIETEFLELAAATEAWSVVGLHHHQ